MESLSNKNLIRLFELRAHNKRNHGYFFLVVSVIISVCLLLILSQSVISKSTTEIDLNNTIKAIQNLKPNENSKLNDLLENTKKILHEYSSPDNFKLGLDATTRVIIGIIGFFIIQIFLKLYRYNLEVSQFYLAVSDSFRVLESDVLAIEEKSFEKITNILIPKNINLETPESPTLIDISGLLQKK